MATAKTFEKAMEQLEKIVKELESGELTLEASIKKFEDGIKLSRLCSRKLEETENRINALRNDSA